MITLGVQTWGTDVGALERYWAAADRLGYARITYGDGLWSFTHDGWTMLGALAVVTKRARIGPAVTYAFDGTAHHPSWIAKRAVAVDHLSGGRLDVRFGIGAEDQATAEAWRAHGIAYPSAAERIARLEESIDVVRALWRGETVTRAGWAQARIDPAPIQRPGSPVWIAAMRPMGLDLVARKAEGWEASYVTPHVFGDLWRDLQRRLAEAGRPQASLTRSIELDVALATDGDARRLREEFCAARGIESAHPLAATVLAGGPDAVAARIAEYAAAGATDLMLGFADFPSTSMLEAFAGEVRPRLAALSRPSTTPPAA